MNTLEEFDDFEKMTKSHELDTLDHPEEPQSEVVERNALSELEIDEDELAVDTPDEVNGRIRREAIRMLPSALEQLRVDMSDVDASVKERLQVVEKVLDLAGSVTPKDKNTYGRGVGEGASAGLQLSAEMFKGVMSTLGDVFGVKADDVKVKRIVPVKEKVEKVERIEE